MFLNQIHSPQDIKRLSLSQLEELSQEIRQALLAKLSVHGGHVGPNLGMVEATIALHVVFDSPHDKIVYDVSHQSYTHKMLTGRAEAFLDPAEYDSVTGYTNRQESEHDFFTVGHTSTSVSLGCGLAHARDLAGDTYNVITVIGDGSLSGGLAFEGFNNAAELDSNLIIIVNDNDQSIAENHGGLYRNLAELRASNGACERNIFRAMGLDYRYLDAGNDVLALVDALQELRNIDHPIVLHVSTAKGKGFEPAQSDPEHWHHVGPFDMATGRKLCPGHPSEPAPRTYADITGAALRAAIERDSQVVGITAATPYIMGFTPELRAAAGKQFVDVGIAEEHAVTFATALARAGAKPVFGVYGTFLQRAYDELWHDLCLNDAPATILVFGASIFGTTSETHLSFFDISMLGGLPYMHYLAPACMEEYLSMLSWSLDHREHPVAIRVPGIGLVSRPDLAPAEDTDYSAVRYNVVRQGRNVAVLALGDFFELGERVANRLAAEYGIEATLVNPRFATELDREFLDGLAAEHRVVVTLEDGILDGGWGERVACYLACTPVRTRTFGIAKGFPDRYDPNELLAQNGMTVENMAAEAVRLLNE